MFEIVMECIAGQGLFWCGVFVFEELPKLGLLIAAHLGFQRNRPWNASQGLTHRVFADAELPGKI